jgi:hypothetical protein
MISKYRLLLAVQTSVWQQSHAPRSLRSSPRSSPKSHHTLYHQPCACFRGTIYVCGEGNLTISSDRLKIYCMGSGRSSEQAQMSEGQSGLFFTSRRTSVMLRLKCCEVWTRTVPALLLAASHLKIFEISF